MKYAIITPTYINHFKYIDTYLSSFSKYVEDKKDIPIFFTISKTEGSQFNEIVCKYKNELDLHVLYFEDLLLENNATLSPEDYMKNFGRFTFQSAKKFYSMLHVNAEKFLVLDCESMWIKPTNMTNLFESYFNNPFIVYSEIDKEKREDKFFNKMVENIDSIIPVRNKYFIEHFMWFYEKKILQNMFNELCSLDEMIKKLQIINKGLEIYTDLYCGIFEIVLYYAYLYNNSKRYHYKTINIDSILRDSLGDELFNNYQNRFYNFAKCGCGLVEHVLMLLDDSDCEIFAKIFKEYNFNIIRCDHSSLENVKLQEKFIKIVQPNILAASQEHVFGINDRYKMLVLKNKYWLKLEKHLFRLTHPQKFSIQLLIEPFSIVFYLIKCYLRIQRNKKKYKRLYCNEE